MKLKKVLKGFLILLAVSLYFFLSVVFRSTELRMYLPEYRAAAIQFAAKYFYQNYTKKISYSHMDIYWLTEDRRYNIYFFLSDEPQCNFVIQVNYDIETNQYAVSYDTYLISTMHDRVSYATHNLVKNIYGKKTKVFFVDDSDGKISENTSLEDVRNNPQYGISIHLEDSIVKNYNLITHARKLYSCYSLLRKRGYTLKYVSYRFEQCGEVYIQRLKILSEINSVKDAEDILREIIGSEEEPV